MFIAVLLIIAKMWKQFKCSVTDEQINKMWHIHRREYYLTIKLNEVLTHGIKLINLQHLLSEGRKGGKSMYKKTETFAFSEVKFIPILGLPNDIPI